MRSAFRGFIVGLWHERQLYRFATYTHAKIEKLAIGDASVDWVIKDKHYRLELKASKAQAGLLRGPSRVDMGRRVNETLQAVVETSFLLIIHILFSAASPNPFNQFPEIR